MADNRLLIKKEGLSIPGHALIELMKAVHEKGVAFRFRVRGFSMSPFIRDGDIITVAPVKDSPLGIGDVVAFIHPETGRLVVHRIIKKNGDSFIIRGDNTPSEDGIIPRTNILGRVIKVERNGKKVLFGIGTERFLIAFLTKRGLLSPLFFPIRPIWRLVKYAKSQF